MADEPQPLPSRNPSSTDTSGVTEPPIAPVGPEVEVDEELASLPRSRPRSPLIGLLVIAIGLLLIAKIWPDVRYSLSGSVPQELGDARALGLDAARELPAADNTWVAVHGLPDFRNGLLFEPKGDSYRRAFYRMMGTGSRLWVRAEQTSTRHELSDRLVGRLRHFDELPYAGQVRDYYAKKVKTTRLLDGPSLRAALAGGMPSGPLVDQGGEPVKLEPDTKLTFVINDPSALQITLAKDKFAVEEDARHEAERLGVPVTFLRETRAGFVYRAQLGGLTRDGLIARLDDRSIPFQADRSELVVVASKVAVAPDDALTAGGRTLPWSVIESVQLSSPVIIPSDHAWVLIEGDVPGDNRWALLLASGLAIFLLLNAWMLTRSLRAR